MQTSESLACARSMLPSIGLSRHIHGHLASGCRTVGLMEFCSGEPVAGGRGSGRHARSAGSRRFVPPIGLGRVARPALKGRNASQPGCELGIVFGRLEGRALVDAHDMRVCAMSPSRGQPSAIVDSPPRAPASLFEISAFRPISASPREVR